MRQGFQNREKINARPLLHIIPSSIAKVVLAVDALVERLQRLLNLDRLSAVLPPASAGGWVMHLGIEPASAGLVVGLETSPVGQG